MKKLIEDFTLQLNKALKIGESIRLSLDKKDIQYVVASGMGGSGIGANIIRSLALRFMSIPMLLSKEATIPKFVGSSTLFIACSYSGNTEEILVMLQKAISQKAHIVCITTGGKMLEWAKKNNQQYVLFPNDSESARSMIGYQIILLLFVLHHVGLLGSFFIQETKSAVLHINRIEKSIQSNARKIAKRLKDKLPIIYCDELIHPLAIRFANQINENSKQLAHVNSFPEIMHNEIVGWQFPKHLLNHIQVIYLRSDYETQRTTKSLEICQDNIEQLSSHPIIDIIASGDSILEQFYYLIHLTDWVSFFLANENQVDAIQIDIIKELKSKLANTP